MYVTRVPDLRRLGNLGTFFFVQQVLSPFLAVGAETWK